MCLPKEANGNQKEYTVETSNVLYIGRVWLFFFFNHTVKCSALLGF